MGNPAQVVECVHAYGGLVFHDVAGHGVGSISDIPATAELVERMRAEYEDASPA